MSQLFHSIVAFCELLAGAVQRCEAERAAVCVHVLIEQAQLVKQFCSLCMTAVPSLLIMLPITVSSANFISRDFIYTFGMHNKSESFRQLMLIPLINWNT